MRYAGCCAKSFQPSSRCLPGQTGSILVTIPRMLRGDVATMAVEAVLDWAARRRVSGLLSFEKGNAVRRLALSGGAILWTSSSEAEEQVGQILLAMGAIDAETLADALDVGTETEVA